MGPKIGARLIVASHRQRNDRRKPELREAWNPAEATPAHAAGTGHRRRLEEAQTEWLWGWHPVVAALGNPARAPVKRLVATADRARAVAERFGPGRIVETAEAAAISQLIPQGAAHQGVALRIPQLEPTTLDDLAQPARGLLLMLDQITDPQNVGAIFRTAAAFGARGVILQDRHAPALSGALAKAAAGAIDTIPHARETNLSRSLERLEALGWRAVGLDGAAPDELAAVLDASPTVLVMGSEGEGLRRLVREHCDVLAKILMPGGFESLNVSAAAAVALYEASRPR
jgi:23S rRNA (guanosine2251-2'-O)-methyltransferase